MTALASCIYAGKVVHKRLAPRRHAFSYRVYALCLDVDEIDLVDRQTRLFSRGRFNLLGFHDRDYAAGDGERIADHIRRQLGAAGLDRWGARVSLLSYPRVLGYVFNPLSVYFCRNGEGALGVVVYEVSNTFGERVSYVIRAAGEAADARGVLAHGCRKDMYVSPFTAASADYGFHVLPPAERVVVGVALREDGRAVLKTHFTGERRPFDDRVIAGLALTHPLVTLKVMSAIHFEAVRLWLKGVPMVPRHVSPRYAVKIVQAHPDEATHG